MVSGKAAGVQKRILRCSCKDAACMTCLSGSEALMSNSLDWCLHRLRLGNSMAGGDSSKPEAPALDESTLGASANE